MFHHVQQYDRNHSISHEIFFQTRQSCLFGWPYDTCIAKTTVEYCSGSLALETQSRQARLVPTPNTALLPCVEPSSSQLPSTSKYLNIFQNPFTYFQCESSFSNHLWIFFRTNSFEFPKRQATENFPETEVPSANAKQASVVDLNSPLLSKLFCTQVLLPCRSGRIDQWWSMNFALEKTAVNKHPTSKLSTNHQRKFRLRNFRYTNDIAESSNSSVK